MITLILTKEVEVDVPKAEHSNIKLVKMIPDMPMAKKRVMMGEVDDMTCSSRSRAYPRPTTMWYGVIIPPPLNVCLQLHSLQALAA